MLTLVPRRPAPSDVDLAIVFHGPPGLGGDAGPAAPPLTIARAFEANPYLELLRLLRAAAEIEHLVLLQYLFSAFTIRDDACLVGIPAPTTGTFLGLCVQEMRHFGRVNRMLVSLGAKPHLQRPAFPTTQGIYPFAFSLEPLSLKSIARFIYLEAARDVFDERDTVPFVRELIDKLQSVLGPTSLPGLGSIYFDIRNIAGQVSEWATTHRRPQLASAATEAIAMATSLQTEGENNHYVFMCKLLGIALPDSEPYRGYANVGWHVEELDWDRAPNDVKAVAVAVAPNPSAYVGHPSMIPQAGLRRLAWLGNLHYWTMLMLLDVYFQASTARAGRVFDCARKHMERALSPIGFALAAQGTGMPFDVYDGELRGTTNGGTPTEELLQMLDEIAQFQMSVDPLPKGYDPGLAGDTAAILRDKA